MLGWGTNHPRMLSALQRAKRNGCKLVHINPLPEVGMTRFKHPQQILGLLGAGTELADLFLQVKINGDVALLKGIMKVVLERDLLDRDFIETYTEGFEDFRRSLESFSWEEIVSQAGVSQDLIEKAADIFVSSERTIFCWAMGLRQNRNAVASIQRRTASEAWVLRIFIATHGNRDTTRRSGGCPPPPGYPGGIR